MKNPLSVRFKVLEQYDFTKLVIDEVVFFEWLVLKRSSFGSEKFSCQQQRIINEIGIRRRRLTTIKNKFIDLYGLESETEGKKNITHFTVKDLFLKKFVEDNIQVDLQKDLIYKLKNIKFKEDQ